MPSKVSAGREGLVEPMVPSILNFFKTFLFKLPPHTSISPSLNVGLSLITPSCVTLYSVIVLRRESILKLLSAETSAFSVASGILGTGILSTSSHFTFKSVFLLYSDARIFAGFPPKVSRISLNLI